MLFCVGGKVAAHDACTEHDGTEQRPERADPEDDAARRTSSGNVEASVTVIGQFFHRRFVTHGKRRSEFVGVFAHVFDVAHDDVVDVVDRDIFLRRGLHVLSIQRIGHGFAHVHSFFFRHVELGIGLRHAAIDTNGAKTETASLVVVVHDHE